jgi:rhamnogalacturonan endolyase
MWKYAPTGQFFQQWWFLRDGETGYHSFTRLQYTNETVENIGNLQEFRQVVSQTHLAAGEIGES